MKNKRIKVSFYVSENTYEKLQKMSNLLHVEVPSSVHLVVENYTDEMLQATSILTNEKYIKDIRILLENMEKKYDK